MTEYTATMYARRVLLLIQGGKSYTNALDFIVDLNKLTSDERIQVDLAYQNLFR